MTLTCPLDPPWLVTVVAGEFPLGDEDAMFALADGWRKAANDSRATARTLLGSGDQLHRAGSDGSAVADAGSRLRRIAADLQASADHSDITADQVYSTAVGIEFTKLLIIWSVRAMEAQLVVDALTWFAGGPVRAAVQRAATRRLVQAAAKKLIDTVARDGVAAAAKRALLLHTAKPIGLGTGLGAAMGGGVNYWAQREQIRREHRTSVDVGAVLEATGAGALSGAVGAATALKVAPAVAGFVTRRFPAAAAATVSRYAAHLLTGMVVGGASGGTGALAGTGLSWYTAIQRGQHLAARDWINSAVTGFGGGFLGSAVGALPRPSAAHQALAERMPAPTRPAEGPAPSGKPDPEPAAHAERADAAPPDEPPTDRQQRLTSEPQRALAELPSAGTGAESDPTAAGWPEVRRTVDAADTAVWFELPLDDDAAPGSVRSAAAWRQYLNDHPRVERYEIHSPDRDSAGLGTITAELTAHGHQPPPNDPGWRRDIAADPYTDSRISRMPIPAEPKIELHVHLEGTVGPRTLLDIARRNGIDLMRAARDKGIALPAATVHDLQEIYQYTDFRHFLDIWRLTTGVLRTEADFRQIVVDYAAAAAEHGLVYAEAQFSPGTRFRNGVSLRAMFDGVAAGVADAAALHGVDIRLIPSVVWEDSPAVAEKIARLAAEYRSRGVVGLGLGGRRAPGVGIETFRTAIDLAAAAGLGFVPHAGEEGGAREVREVMAARPDRIQHAFFQPAEDPRLAAELAELGIVVDAAPISNLRTGVVADLADHPVRHLAEAGVRISISTDDPAMFGNNLDTEYAVARQLGIPAEVAYFDALQGILAEPAARWRLTAIGETAYGPAAEPTPDAEMPTADE